MAELMREADNLVLKLSTAEKMESVHGDIRVPISAVKSVTVLDDVIHAVRGIKMPGTRIPGVVAMGTFLSGSDTTFAIVHHQNKRGLKVVLADRSSTGLGLTALIIGLDDPEGVMGQLGLSTSFQ